jgi:two-component system cell cycle response regulator DivK
LTFNCLKWMDTPWPTELKKHRELSDTPIIAVTSYAMVGDKERILAAGATGYIEKPINPETFVAEIVQYLAENASDQG